MTKSPSAERTRLDRAFFARGAEAVARELLGAVLVHRRGDDVLRARVVETEAYVGMHDLACHASKGKTRRNAVMFGPAGHAYVYLIYGMYQMLNVVTATEGDPQAVLLRAVEPLFEGARSASGPGRLTMALGIEATHNGVDMCGDALYFEAAPPPRVIAVAPRVGVDYAGPWKDAPLRFFDDESRAVSARPKIVQADTQKPRKRGRAR